MLLYVLFLLYYLVLSFPLGSVRRDEGEGYFSVKLCSLRFEASKNLFLAPLAASHRFVDLDVLCGSGELFLVGRHHLGNALEGGEEVLAGKLGIAGELAIVVRVVDASLSLDEESIDGALEEVFCRVLRLDEDVESVD